MPRLILIKPLLGVIYILAMITPVLISGYSLLKALALAVSPSATPLT